MALLVASILVGWTKPLVLIAQKERDAAGVEDAEATLMLNAREQSNNHGKPKEKVGSRFERSAMTG